MNRQFLNVTDLLNSLLNGQQQSIMNFLEVIFLEILEESTNVITISNYVDFLDFPIIMSHKMFSLMDLDQDNKLSKEEFVLGMFNFFSGDYSNFLINIFSILDYNNENTITKEKIIITLNHYSKFYKFDEEIKEILYNIIESVFCSFACLEHLSLQDFENLIQTRNSDLFFILFFIIFKYKPYDKANLAFFSFDKNNNKNNNNNYIYNYECKSRLNNNVYICAPSNYILEFLSYFNDEYNLQILDSKNGSSLFLPSPLILKNSFFKEENNGEPNTEVNGENNKNFCFSSSSALIGLNSTRDTNKVSIYDLFNSLVSHENSYEGYLFKHYHSKNKRRMFYVNIQKKKIFFYTFKKNKYHPKSMHYISNKAVAKFSEMKLPKKVIIQDKIYYSVNIFLNNKFVEFHFNFLREANLFLISLKNQINYNYIEDKYKIIDEVETTNKITRYTVLSKEKDLKCIIKSYPKSFYCTEENYILFRNELDQIRLQDNFIENFEDGVSFYLVTLV